MATETQALGGLINRMSSRTGRLSHTFLKDRLKGATEYLRIAGYFRSSILQLIHEEISEVGVVKVVCNSDLDPLDITTAGLLQRHVDKMMVEKWHEQEDPTQDFGLRGSYAKLHNLLSSGKLEVKVVSRDKGAFLHGKAGLITRSDGSTSSFIGSVNESIQGWDHSYETIWEDPSQEAADWVREEFDHLWEKARPLSEAVISEIDKAARKSEVSLKDALVKPKDLAKSSFQDTPIQRSGEDLAVWQKAFVEIWEEHRNLYGAARIILADEVGVGKTLSMAATGALSVLYGDGPFLILCPATLVDQWQVELIDKLGLPSAVWKGGRRGGWRDHTGHLIRMDDPDGILKCPYQIGIVSTGIITASTPEAEILKRGKFGMIALDEGHKARKKRGIGGKEADEEGLLHDFMMNIAGNTKHLVIGTATPIQTDKREIWDLMKIIAVGNEHVLGRTNSPWWDDSLSLGVVSGDFPLRTMDEAWEFLRSPLPSRAESEKVFGAIRDAFDVPDKKFFCDKSISELHDTFDWGFIVDEYESSRDEIPFMRKHNPLSRHVVLRRRETLENAELMPRIAVDIFPESKKSDGIFWEGAIATPNFYDQAYAAVEDFTAAMQARIGVGGFIKSMMLQRICSSIHAGITTAQKMQKIRDRAVSGEVTAADDESLIELMEAAKADPNVARALIEETYHLDRVVDLLGNRKEDPKKNAVMHFLKDQRWAEKGCIMFSQYYDTARWIGEQVSVEFPEDKVAVYAGAGRSGIFINKEWKSFDREDLKRGIRKREIRLVCATDAACEGLNLQTLGTLINIDLPWNPSKLEQRIGRIKRFGQALSAVNMANLIYQGTRDDDIYSKLSERLQDRYSIIGSLPDVIEADWIDDIKEVKKQFKKFTKKEMPKDVFEVKYGDIRSAKVDAWDRHAEVLSKSDMREAMMRPWNKAS